MNPTWLTATASLAGVIVAGYLWATRHIVRDELQPMRQDIEVLRVAVFNHISHGERPNEGEVRERLGYGRRK